MPFSRSTRRQWGALREPGSGSPLTPHRWRPLLCHPILWDLQLELLAPQAVLLGQILAAALGPIRSQAKLNGAALPMAGGARNPKRRWFLGYAPWVYLCEAAAVLAACHACGRHHPAQPCTARLRGSRVEARLRAVPARLRCSVIDSLARFRSPRRSSNRLEQHVQAGLLVGTIEKGDCNLRVDPKFDEQLRCIHEDLFKGCGGGAVALLPRKDDVHIRLPLEEPQ
mmetsp:Transcript_8060/g.21129  ORF Transcript_8060/g.21129 Transcript_8060/m.21129 type:complete len:226 (-) Transcript_8060:2965-3642(-)